MNAFISYSHQDTGMLEMLHKHLAQLQRENIITTWTDREIMAGGNLDQHIDKALSNAQLFLALLSADYIASNYCYEKEFLRALQMQEDDQIIIIPIIVEPCDWLSTPFSKFKALPKDGKPISAWENRHTALLDVIQHIRKLIAVVHTDKEKPKQPQALQPDQSRNYRVQKDFDSIEKIEFIEQTFREIRDFLRRYMDEILQMDNIKTRILKDDKAEFECLLVNRNKIDTESQLTVTTQVDNKSFSIMRSGNGQILFAIGKNNRATRSFQLFIDEYHLFWSDGSMFPNYHNSKEISSREMADKIWNEWLESVGII